MTNNKIEAISNLVVGLKYHEWCRIRVSIEQKFSSAAGRVELSDAEELRRAIEMEFKC